jgi:hypothetical protein
MPDLHLSLSVHPALLAAAAGIAALFSWFVYRVTVPPVPRLTRLALAVLRWSGLFFLLLFLGEPLLSLLYRTVELPVTVVLVDDSRSMTIKDRSGERRTVLTTLLQSDAVRDLASVGTVRYGVFGGKTRFLDSFSIDSLNFSNDATDIAEALRRVKDLSATSNIQAVVLLTDGNITVGSTPESEAQELGLPIFTVGIGDTSEQRDLLVRKVLTNALAYVGSKVPVHVTIKSSGFTGERVEVVLRDATSELDRRTVTLGSGTREYTVPLTMIPQKEGTQKFTVEVSRLADELTHENNRSTFFVKVLKSKMRIVLVAGAPSPDVAFIRRALASDEHVEISSFIERGGGQFYEGPFSAAALNDADGILLVGFPGAQSSVGAVSVVADAANSGKPLFLILSRTVDFTKLRLLEPHLPVVFSGASTDELQAFFVVPETQRNNAILKLARADGVDAWSTLAPIFRLQMTIRVKPEAEVLAITRVQNVTINEPFLVSRNVNRRKSLALLGYGIWRWKMMSEPVPGTESLLEEFLSNAVRWLTTREDERRIRIQPIKESFSGQEHVEFSGQAYDENYRPLDDAQITVTVTRDRQTSEMTLDPIGSGQYEGSFGSLEEGDYQFTASVKVDGKTIGEDRGTFSVGGINVEFQETRMNKALLEQLAARTGGRYFTPTTAQSLAQSVASLPNFKPREVTRTEDIELWNRSWMLALVVGLFSLEWIVRKRHGML